MTTSTEVMATLPCNHTDVTGTVGGSWDNARG